jgi:phage-related protein
MPHARAMGGGLFEMRAKGRAGIGRVMYCVVVGKRIVLLHAFIKKTERTPPRELSLAYVRAREVKHDYRSL